MIGGIGNQMFQYALFRRLKNMYDDVYYESFYAKPHHNGFELENTFNIIQNPLIDKTVLDKLIRFQENTWPHFNPEILNKKDGTYLCGNWQNIGYFPEESILRNELSFKQELDEKNKDILKEIKETNSISIHARRGDFLHDGLNHFFPDWFNYYGLAVSYIMKNTNKRPIKFFVFSDDIDWCKKNFMISATYVENKKNDSWKDMMLMSNCKHNIITNSTFSWWGAWLNNNLNKIVVNPKHWLLNDRATDNIALKEWIKI